MDAPFARHLVRFSRVPPAGASAAPISADVTPETVAPSVTMTIAAFEARLEAARHDARAMLEADHAACRASAEAGHAETLVSAVAAASSRRDAEEAVAIAAQITAAMEGLRDMLSGQLAKALHALFAEAVAARTVAALVEAIERALADPDHPALTVRGPGPLLAEIEASLGAGSVTFEVANADEVTVSGTGLRIETRLAAALAALAIEDL